MNWALDDVTQLIPPGRTRFIIPSIHSESDPVDLKKEMLEFLLAYDPLSIRLL